MIRARQGHSIKPPHIDHTLLDMTEILHPSLLPSCFHGTYWRYLDAIMTKGLSRMRRQHIHMAKGFFGEVQSGYRKDCDVLISIDVEKSMREGGLKFYESGNGVVLSEGDNNGCIPAQYFKEIIDLASSSASASVHVSPQSHETTFFAPVVDIDPFRQPLPEELIKKWKSVPMSPGGNVVGFYSHQGNEYASFSNFYEHRPISFVIPSWCGSRKGETVEVEFSEKSIMLCKASLFGDDITFEAIKQAKTPAKCKKFGRQVRGFRDEKWYRYICSIALAAVYCKFSQIADIKDILLDTGKNLIAEAAPDDKIWGIGLPMNSMEIQEPIRWRGMNILGWALMEARMIISTSV